MMTPEDHYLVGLLLQHKVLDANKLDMLERTASAHPGMRLADVIVEAGIISFQHRKVIAAMLTKSDMVGEMLAGRVPAELVARPVNAEDTALPEGVPRDMAATRLDTEGESSGFSTLGGSSVSIDKADTRDVGRLEATVSDRGAADPERSAITLVQERDAAATIPFAASDPSNPFESAASGLWDRDKAATLPPDAVGETGGALATGTPLRSGGVSFGMGGMDFLLNDSGSVDLMEEARAGHLDISRILSDEERSRVEEGARRAGGMSLIGRKLGGYVVLDKLGEGGQGEVYLAKQLSLNRYVALKVLPREYSYDQGFVQRFIHEANMLAKLTHSNVVRIFDVARAGELLYLTMENIQGQSLKDLIVREGHVPLDVAINIVKQCCRALGRVKREGITHRDIKPGNILLDAQGEVKVVDFGLADLSKSLQSRTAGHTAGTPYYMPPESIMNKPATHLSDQYSLGATFYHMITGRPPFSARTAAETAELHLKAEVPRASDTKPEIPHEVDAIIRRMMAKGSLDRFATFREVFEALEAVELKLGLRTTQEGFLGDEIVQLKDASIRNLKQNVVWWLFVAVVFAYAGVGLNLFVRAFMDGGDAAWWIDVAGNWGTYFVTIAYMIILYVGMVRKRWVRDVWSVRRWIQVHIALALTGSFLLMVHSGNFLRDYLALPIEARVYVKPVAFLPMINSIVLMFVVASGFVGRYIYRDLQRQAALERIGAEGGDEEARTSPARVTMIVITQRVMGLWRIVHYPLTIVFFLLTAAHVGSILYFGGTFLPAHPDAGWLPAGSGGGGGVGLGANP